MSSIKETAERFFDACETGKGWEGSQQYCHVDATFSGTEEWYETMARSRPPRDEPWYHVLVHGAEHSTYVAERNLEPDPTGEPIAHPVLDRFFDEFRNGAYVRHRTIH